MSSHRAPVPGGTVRDGVGVGVAARRVGVAAATLRAWERRYGLQPTGHTPGGHRRYSAADVATLQRMQHLVESGMPTASAATLSRTGSSRTGSSRTGSSRTCVPDEPLAGAARSDIAIDHYAQLSAAAAALGAAELARVARAVIGQRGVVAAWTQVFVPHLHAMGRHWSATGEGIECEHLTVAVLQSVLRKHALRRRPRSGRSTVLLAAGPGEQHTLPLDVLAAALSDAGVASCVVYDMPPLALHTARERSGSEAVVLWARSAHTADRPLLHSFIGTVSLLCAAGPGWQPAHLPPGMAHVADLPAAVDRLHAWSAT